VDRYFWPPALPRKAGGRNFIQTWDLVGKVPFFQSLDPSAITEITHSCGASKCRSGPPSSAAQGRRLHVLHRRGRSAGGHQAGTGSAWRGASRELALLLNDSVRTANVTTTMPSTLLILDLPTSAP